MARSPKSPGPQAKRIAAKIKAARLDAGLSQQALARELGVSFQQLQKYENGVNRIALERLQSIAQKVGQPITYFFDMDSEAPATENSEIIASIVSWLSRSHTARRVLTALPILNEPDAQLIASLVERVIAQKR